MLMKCATEWSCLNRNILLRKRGPFPILNIIPLPPIGRQSAGAGSGQHRLAEALEDDRDLCQPLLAGLHPGQKLIQLGHDAALFVEGRNRDWMPTDNFLTDIGLRSTLSKLNKYLSL